MPKFYPTERLKSKKIIEELFSKGQSHFLYPFKIVFLNKESPSEEFPKVMFSVSKKNFKKAVDRNSIKRRMRELYRLHKTDLANEEGKYTVAYLGILFIAKEKMEYNQMQKKILSIFKRFKE